MPSTILAIVAALPGLYSRTSQRGVGSRLVREGLAACHAAGHDLVVAVGSPAFLGRFGFVPARPLGLLSERAVEEEQFLAVELTP